MREFMSESKPKRFPDSFVTPLSREEWQADHEQEIALGITPKDETYEDYIAGLRAEFGIVCLPR